MNMPNRIGITTLVALLIGGCTPSHVIPARPVPASTHDSSSSVEKHYWTPNLTAGASRYVVRDSSIVTLSNDSSTKQLVSTTSRIYSLVFSPDGDTFSVSARAESLTVNGQPQAGKNARDSSLGLPFAARLTKWGKITALKTASPSICGSGIEPGVVRMFELLVPYPSSHVSVGSEWADSSSEVICHGKTPLTQQNIRSYRVVDSTTRNHRLMTRIQRTTNTRITAAPADSTMHIFANGSGTAISTLYVDPVSGRILEGDTQSQLALTVSTSRGSFPFKQTIITHIELRRD